ncbi:hypothetical protein R1flu_015623 [Riccia fluitans]|uniref:Uncharacterized protein n=1 Tax=Riccia fluitans TaxID=41844 RepID=A0ABD1YNC2_9MARC
MYCLNMLKYAASLQRHYVPEDIFLWGLQNTDTEGDRLLVKDTRGGTNVIGWNEIVVVFGAKHNDSEDFRSIKVMHTTLDKYNPRAYHPASIEHNPNKKLVSGQPYEEVLYYKDTAPYGPTYYLMTTVTEFVTELLTEFVYKHVTKHVFDPDDIGLSTRDASCRRRFPLRPRIRPCRQEGPVQKTSSQRSLSLRPWNNPCLLKGRRIFPLRRPNSPCLQKGRVEDKERGLPSKKKNKVINSHLLPYVQARIQRHIAATDTWKQAYEVELSKVRELQATNDGLRGQLAAKDAAKSEVHALAWTEVQRELEEFKRSVTKLEDFKRLEEEASCLREALAAKESVVQALENAHQKEISILKATCRKYKTSLDGEIGINADLQARVLNLQDELSTCKYTHEQALQGQKSARAELLEVKKELRMLQVLHQDVDEGNAASAP